MPLQITEFWGFPYPGSGDGLILKVALEAELQSCLWLEHEMSSVQRGQTKARSTRTCGKSRGRAKAECLCLWQRERQEEGQLKDTQGRFVRTCSHGDTVPTCLGVTQGASPGQSLTGPMR